MLRAGGPQRRRDRHAKARLKISALGTVERNTVKVEAAVKKIQEVKPDAVVMISAYSSCAEFIRQMKKAGSAATFYNVSFVGSKALADALGKEGAASPSRRWCRSRGAPPCRW